ncbi:hypothetical protein A2U01_0073059, partial [Trifolium medium]|nr:hypothetical protein [Trifolium medium]
PLLPEPIVSKPNVVVPVVSDPTNERK